MAQYLNQGVAYGGNKPGVIAPSAAFTAAAYNLGPIYNPGARGVRIYFSATVTTGTVDAKVQTFDAASNTWYDLTGASIAQITSTGSKVLTIYPGITASTNVDVNNVLATTWRIVLTIGTATTTVSVGADYLA